MDLLHEKQARLREILRDCGSIAVAFSGGVDSTFLLKSAQEALGSQVLAVTAAPVFVPPRELQEAVSFCEDHGIGQIVIPAEELNVDKVRHNPPDRCYHCKRMIFGKILEKAAEHAITVVAEGSNLDDTGDYRPGMRAVRELGVCSPLLEAELTKAEIRLLSRELRLPTWDKPSFACLASRFQYGETITDERLHSVDRAEQLLLDLGFRQFRVRVHGDLARIEVLPGDFRKIMEDGVRAELARCLKEYGFTYAALDLTGYRTGSMNEVLNI